ncbi:ribonuclease H-like domain-containing protein [Tanacetum coccineum]|uniref:Ribonuclease H-like domain-containing protein n=1 Tax=Tanacetum coccineum TaxID=301880 RepID=A0ABQ5BVN6_9ASTR
MLNSEANDCPSRSGVTVEQTYPPTTAEEKLSRKNELKARGTLLMALPNEHQLKFNTYKCAKTLMEAIEKGLGGKKGQKKLRKGTLLKNSIEFHSIKLRFLRSLPSEWKTHTLIWRNKPDLDTLSMDDLYNNLKIYETEVKGSSSSNQNSRNVAFVSSNNSGSSNQAYGSNSANTDSMSDAVIYSFFANQSNSPQLNDEDLQQIDVDDLEEMDLKWQMAMLTMRAKRFLNKTGRKINANGSETIGFNKSKVECYNCHKKGHFARKCRAPRENRNIEPVRRNVTVETTETKALVAQDGLGYDGCDRLKRTYKLWLLMAYKSSSSSSSSSCRFREYVFSESVTSIPDVATREEQHYDWCVKTYSLDLLLESVKMVENNKQAKYPRKNNQSPRDCDFYENKFMEKPVWNNARRVNHQNSQRMYHPHPKGNFIPRAILMKSGLKTLNTVRQNSLRATVSVNTIRPINAAYPRPTINCAKPTSNVFNRAYSHVRRPFNKFTTNKNNNFNEKVNTVRGNVTTVRPKAVVSDNKGNEANAVKALACWVWRPKQKVLDHVSRHNGASMNFKRFDYIDAQGRSKCSGHMTGNRSYLTDYEDINGGFVAFGGSTKGGKITGKGKIRTGKLDFEDVYFVKELKFNLFSVSQMCDKKNNVLFTDTKCVVPSPDFKLNDESHVLLKVPRKDNMYNIDLKNVVP